MLSTELNRPEFPAPKVLLVTFDWSTLAEMPYLLKKAGCRVEVLCPEANWAIKNAFYDKWIDSGDSMESLLGILTDLVQSQSYRYVMIGDDPILWAIYRRKITTLWHLLPVRNEMALPILSKIGLSEHCRQYNIPSPDFLRVESPSGVQHALRILGLPLILKENYSNGGQGVWVFRDESSLHRFADTYDFNEPLLAQCFIEGRHVDVEALFKDGQLLQYVCSEILEDNYGPSSKRRYFPNIECIGQIIADMGKSACLHGFANMSLMQDANSQTYYLFEADPRPNKWVSYARWFGRDFAPAVSLFLADTAAEGVLPLSVASTPVECWEVEHFTSQCTKLLNAGRFMDAILHLLDFDRNWRYTIYDPVLLKAKLDSVYEQLVPHRDALAAKAAQEIAALQSPSSTFTVSEPPEPSVPTITIDNQVYDTDSLSPNAKAQLVSIQFVDQELVRLRAQTATLQTARNAYVNALKAALVEPLERRAGR